jgi:hypothetical protein
MPFDYDAYRRKIRRMSYEDLVNQKKHYNRTIASGITGELGSIVMIPFSLGLSSVGVLASGAAAVNGAYKVNLIDRELASRGQSCATRKRDVLGGMAIGTASTTLRAGLIARAGQMAAHAASHAITHA